MIRRITIFGGAFFFMAALALPASGQVKSKAVQHDTEGKDNCLMCHTPGAMAPVPDTPESHQGRANQHCMWCHASDSPMVTTGASQTSHDLEGKENCMMCHAAGVMEPVPDVPAESHEGRGNETCLWCHTSKVVGS